MCGYGQLQCVRCAVISTPAHLSTCSLASSARVHLNECHADSCGGRKPACLPSRAISIYVPLFCGEADRARSRPEYLEPGANSETALEKRHYHWTQQ